MKTNRTLLAAVIITLSAMSQLTAQPSGTEAFDRLERTDKIIGMTITDARNQQIGRVKDLAIDLEAGRVVEVLVDARGFPDSKHGIVAVPPESFALEDSGGELRMNADNAAFNNAPAFDISTWKESTEGAKVMDVYKRFHVQLHPGTGCLERARKIMGRTARNQRNQRLCKVETLVVDLPSGRIPEIIVAATDFLGIKGPLTAVPPQAFLYDPDYNALVLDTTREALKKAPHFKSSDWRNAVDDAISESAVYDTIKVLRALTDEGMDNAAPDTIIASRNNK